MKITVTQQVLGGKVEKSVILDDPERTSLAPAAKTKTTTKKAAKVPSGELVELGPFATDDVEKKTADNLAAGGAEVVEVSDGE